MSSATAIMNNESGTKMILPNMSMQNDSAHYLVRGLLYVLFLTAQ